MEMNAPAGAIRATRSPLRLRLLAFVLLAGASLSDLRADLWYEHYERGLDAIKSQHWDQAVQELQKAYELRKNPGTSVRTYGMNFVNYHPYLQLGIAYFNLGRFDAALQAFDTETGYGAIAKSESDLRNLQTFRRLALERQRETIQTEEERIARIVATSVSEARALADVADDRPWTGRAPPDGR